MSSVGAITQFAAPTSFGSTNYGTLLTAGGSAHLKGAYTQLFASTAFAADGFFTQIVRATATGRTFMVDIAEGAAAAEVVTVANLVQAVGDDQSGGASLWDCPKAIALGTRVSARCQCTVASSQMLVAAYLYARDGLVSTITSFSSYGPDVALTNLPVVDPGAAANTKGAYTEITPSTTAALRRLTLLVTYQNTFPTFGQWRLDIAQGAAASEVVLLGDLVFSTADLSDTILPRTWEFEIAVAISTRLAIRAQSTITNATDRVIDVELLAGNGAGDAPVSDATPLGWMSAGVQILGGR